VHVSNRIDVDEEPDHSDRQHHHRREGIDEEADRDLEIPRDDPRVEIQIKGLTREDLEGDQ
jgi:hypothetical protein